MSRLSMTVAVLSIGLLLNAAPATAADDPDVGRNPPRLSYVDGEVSFWRPGAEDWTEARINTPLAPGDQMYTGDGAILELQIGARAYVRADGGTQIGIENHEIDFVQLKVTSGRVSLDLRSLAPGQSVELNTPSAAIAIEQAGYYRAEVDAETTSVLVRRGGRALVTPVNAAQVTLGSGAASAIRGTELASVETYAAPEPDAWDGWNEGRSDQLVASVSSQYVPDDVYGTEELDRHGGWRTVPTYGSVWVPRSVAPGWAPYTAGRWIWDGYYGWTWLSYDPWGWAPFHYGRWVYFDDYWGWAPGPRVVSAVYYPALVAFFGGGVSVGVGFGPVGWVSLGWGEPIYPWWGRRGFIGEPCWYGWGGPRNHIHVHKTKIINKNKIVNIDGYSNSRHRNGVVVVPRERFGRDGIEKARLRDFDRRGLRPVNGRLAIKPTSDSLTPKRERAGRPPRDVVNRPVVGTRRPHDVSSRLTAEGIRSTRTVPESRVRLVDRPGQSRQARVRPAPLGSSRPSARRSRFGTAAPPLAPRSFEPASGRSRPQTNAPRVAPRSSVPVERSTSNEDSARRRRALEAPPVPRGGVPRSANTFNRQASPRRQETLPANRSQAPARPRLQSSAPRPDASVGAPAAQPRMRAPSARSRPQQSVSRQSSPRERPARTQRGSSDRGGSRSFSPQSRGGRSAGGDGGGHGGRGRSRSD